MSSGARWWSLGDAGRRVLPADYVRRHVELAYATTAYGAQGSTVPVSHVLVGEHTGAASAYVGMTRGRERNVAHLVAESVDDARRQWIEVFGRDRADLGPAHAARLAADAIDRYGPKATRPALRPPAPPDAAMTTSAVAHRHQRPAVASASDAAPRSTCGPRGRRRTSSRAVVSVRCSTG